MDSRASAKLKIENLKLKIPCGKVERGLKNGHAESHAYKENLAGHKISHKRRMIPDACGYFLFRVYSESIDGRHLDGEVAEQL
jgi:hypothetical protein